MLTIICRKKTLLSFKMFCELFDCFLLHSLSFKFFQQTFISNNWPHLRFKYLARGSLILYNLAQMGLSSTVCPSVHNMAAWDSFCKKNSWRNWLRRSEICSSKLFLWSFLYFKQNRWRVDLFFLKFFPKLMIYITKTNKKLIN